MSGGGGAPAEAAQKTHDVRALRLNRAEQGDDAPTLFPVTFCSGSTVLGIETLDGNGEARLTFSWKNAGSYKIKAVYSGDSNFASITSSVMTETVT